MSCSKDDISLTQDDLQGIWLIESYTFNGHEMDINDCEQRKMIIITETHFSVSMPSIDERSKECENPMFHHRYSMIDGSIEIDYNGSGVRHNAILESAGKLIVESRYKDWNWLYTFTQ